MGTIFYDYCVYQSKLLPQQLWKFSNHNIAIYKCDICEIKKYSQVKAILAFTIESVSRYFLIYYIYTTHSIFVSLMMLGQETGVLVAENFLHLIMLDTPLILILITHTINIYWQKENRLVVVPFAANDVFRIMEITFTPEHFLIVFQFRHLLWPYFYYCIKSILKKFID